MEIKSRKIEKSRIVVEGRSFSAYYEQAIQAIIRPPKNTYSKDSLGPNLFCLAGGRSYQRIDQEIIHDNVIIETSTFMAYEPDKPNRIPPNLILFCHCNSSNRLECMQYLEFLPRDYAIAGFDFIGCGNSDGDYITLGVK